MKYLLVYWRNQYVPFFGSAAQQKAAQFPLEVNVDNFQGSGGLLRRWKE